jgi:pyridoxamine 5'-phosphate oxidase
MHADPIERFELWFQEAGAIGVPTPEAMVLATVAPDGQPSSRVVLYRGLSGRCPRFFTNYDSRKGHELAQNPRAALLFHWDALQRQVRFEGAVERLSPAESDAYFASRPRGHQLNAWTSHQSAPIESRGALLARYAELEALYGGRPVPRPPHWGGFRLVPRVIELWQGMPDRMHEREVYTRVGDGWGTSILSP